MDDRPVNRIAFLYQPVKQNLNPADAGVTGCPDHAGLL